MKYDKTQKGNPHQLVIDQHVFPSASIKRYVAGDGMVEVCRLKDNTRFKAKPDNDIFVAKRVWSHDIEVGEMKRIEDEFQKLVKCILKEPSFPITNNSQRVISKFYALWYLRAYYRRRPFKNQQLVGVCGDKGMNSVDLQERLEKTGVRYIRPDGLIAGRQVTGDAIIIHKMSLLKRMKGLQWVIVKANKGEFIVPDISPNAIVPVTPSIVIISQQEVSQKAFVEISEEAVKQLNSLFVSSSQEYYFARDINNCPCTFIKRC